MADIAPRRNKAGGAISTTLKTGENRHVSVSPSCHGTAETMEEAFTFLRLGAAPSGYVLTAEDGGPMYPGSPTGWFSDCPGVEALTILKRLGHGRTSATGDIYGHALAKRDEPACEVLDGLVYQKKRIAAIPVQAKEKPGAQAL